MPGTNTSKKSTSSLKNFSATAADAVHIAGLSCDYVEECGTILKAIHRLAEFDNNFEVIRALAKVGADLSTERHALLAYEVEVIERNLSALEGGAA